MKNHNLFNNLKYNLKYNKDKQNQILGARMVEHMKTMMEKEIFSAATEKTEYNAKQKMELPEWLM